MESQLAEDESVPQTKEEKPSSTTDQLSNNGSNNVSSLNTKDILSRIVHYEPYIAEKSLMAYLNF